VLSVAAESQEICAAKKQEFGRGSRIPRHVSADRSLFPSPIGQRALTQEHSMRIRRIVVAALVVALGTGTAALAAPQKAALKTPPLCHQVVDPANDEISAASLDPSLPSAAGRPYDPALDVVSADIATDANTLTGVIRVAKLTVGDQLAPTGRMYRLSWTVRSSGTGGAIYAQVTPTGNVFDGGDGTGVVDLAKNEVRISVPISRLVGHPVFGPGEALTNLTALTDLAYPYFAGSESVALVQLGVTAYTYGGDSTAPAAKPYPIGAPTCVKVGA
jgi:hypothetical protein